MAFTDPRLSPLCRTRLVWTSRGCSAWQTDLAASQLPVPRRSQQLLLASHRLCCTTLAGRL